MKLLISIAMAIRDWWGALTCPPDRIWMRCWCCGRSFAAGEEHLLETGLVAEAYEGGDEAVVTMGCEQKFKALFPLDDGALAELEQAEPGDRVQTGVVHWCDRCLRDAGLVGIDEDED